MYQFKKFQKQSNTRLNLEQFAKPQEKISKEELKPFSQMSVSNIPHCLAILNEMPLKREDNGLFNFKNTRQLWQDYVSNQKLLVDGVPATPQYFIGLLKVLNRSPRGDILGSGIRQNSETGSRFSAPVPLVLSAFKQYRNIGYEEWDWQDIDSLDDLDWFMDRDIKQIVEYRHAQLDWSIEELLEFREQCNPQQKPLQQVTTANKILDSGFSKLPRMVKLLLLQLWVFHPSVRHPLAITNLENFDEPSKPLVSGEVVILQQPREEAVDIWSI